MTTYFAQIDSLNNLVDIDMSKIYMDSQDSLDVKNIEVEQEYYEKARAFGINYYTYDVKKNKIVKNPNYASEETLKRQAYFESQFIETSMLDADGNFAWYRQIPNGYANAPQTIEIVDKYVRDAQGMTEQIASLLIFYQKPDFTKEEECTDEWLIAHQFNPSSDMTLQQWLDFEMDFQIRWARLKYKRQQTEQ